MRFELIPWVSYWGQIIQMICIICALMYMLYRYRDNLLSIFLILLCWPNVFIFFGNTYSNVYKILMLLLCGYVFLREKGYQQIRGKDGWFVAAFVLFSIQFLCATFLYSSNTITIIFSQYARYVEAFMLYFVIKRIVYFEPLRRDNLLRLLYEIGLLQIILSVIKWFTLGMVEGWVGTFSIVGGEMGTTIPILWFMVLWFYRKGRFSWKDWLYLAGLFFLGFTTGKRAVMFILPLVVAALMIYVKGIRLNRYMAIALCCVPFLFYFGVRLTPTLNPEHKVWGSFDIDYAFNYAETYQFGEKGIEGQRQQDDEKPYISYSNSGFRHGDQIEAEGRGGATIALVKLIFSERRLTDQDLWGIGFKNMYGIDYDEFDKLPLTIHINHKGSATGVFQSYVTTGVLGALCTIIFCFLPFFYCKHRRLRWVLLGITFWEYFFYTGSIFRTPIFMVVVFFVIFYANQEYYQTKKAVKVK